MPGPVENRCFRILRDGRRCEVAPALNELLVVSMEGRLQDIELAPLTRETILVCCRALILPMKSSATAIFSSQHEPSTGWVGKGQPLIECRLQDTGEVHLGGRRYERLGHDGVRFAVEDDQADRGAFSDLHHGSSRHPARNAKGVQPGVRRYRRQLHVGQMREYS